MNLPMLDLHEYIRVMFFRRFEGWFSRHLEGWLTQNERVVLTMETSEGREIVVVLIGDKYVNKIDLYVEEGSEVIKGSKIAFIARGSQTDIIVPVMDGVSFCEASGKRVTAGQSMEMNV